MGVPWSYTSAPGKVRKVAIFGHFAKPVQKKSKNSLVFFVELHNLMPETYEK